MSEAFQEWVIARLAGDGALQALFGGTVRIHDVIPAQRRFPFIVIGPVETVPDGTDNLPGQAMTITVHVWSRSANRREAFRLSDRIGALLEQAPAVHGTLRIVLASVIASLVQRREADDAFHAQLRLRALTEAA